MPRAAVKFTARDYNALPEHPRYELIEGELHLTPSPSRSHQEISGNILAALREWVLGRKLGKVYHAPLDVILSDETVVQPDLLVVLNRNSAILREKVFGAPDLVIEILSPSTADRDLSLKRRLYYRHGVAEYWVVDPTNRTIDVSDWTKADFHLHKTFAYTDTLVSPLLMGFQLPVGTLFD